MNMNVKNEYEIQVGRWKFEMLEVLNDVRSRLEILLITYYSV